MSEMPSAKRVSDPVGKTRAFQFQVSYSSQAVVENDDLLSAILLRSPAKSLLQLKLVSKKWLSLISDDHFRRRYAVDRLSRQPGGLFLIYNKESSKDYEFFPVAKIEDYSDEVNPSLKFLNAPSDYVKILQCCNGLSLCRSIRKCVRSSSESETRVTHYVCNLSTKEFIVLPPFYPRVKKIYHYIFLAFDPTLSPHYKVICAHTQRRKMKNFHEIEIFSSKTGAWNPTTVSHPAPQNSRFYDANYCKISWNGWIIWPHSPWNEHKCLYFDSDSECMKTMKLPEQLSTRARRPHFASCGSRFFILDLVRIKFQLKVYEFERGADTWLMKYQVGSDDMAVLCPTLPYADSCCRVLSGFPVKEKDDFVLVFRLEKELVYYSVKDKSSRKIVDCRRYWSYCSEVHQHFETLCRP